MRQKTYQSWTRKEEERLCALRWEGKSARDCATLLGRTLHSVRCKLAEKGHARPSLAARRLCGAWLAAFRQPHNVREVAERFGVHYTTAQKRKQVLRKAGFWVLPASGRYGRKEGRA